VYRGRVWACEARSAGTLDTLERKRLHVKQSIDHALNTLRAHSHSGPHSHTLVDPRKQLPLHNQPRLWRIYVLPDNETVPNDVFAPGRPSLPHICNELSVSSHSTSSRRSRLTGQDAKPEPPRSSTTHKLGSLNLFMKYAQHWSQHT
jgi:hypothetical protein